MRLGELSSRILRDPAVRVEGNRRTWAGIENVTELRFQPNLVTDDADRARGAALAAARHAGKSLQQTSPSRR